MENFDIVALCLFYSLYISYTFQFILYFSSHTHTHNARANAKLIQRLFNCSSASVLGDEEELQRDIKKKKEKTK